MQHAIVQSKDYDYLLEKEFVHWYAIAARTRVSIDDRWWPLVPAFNYCDIQSCVGAMKHLTEDEAFIELL